MTEILEDSDAKYQVRPELAKVNVPSQFLIGREYAPFTETYALAVSRWIEDQTGWSIKNFVRTARRYRTSASPPATTPSPPPTPSPTSYATPSKQIHHPDRAH